MTDNIKLPAPKFLYFEEIGELHEPGDYAPSDCVALYTADQVREAVRLNATVPEISTEHGPWVESNIHEGETYCKRCLVRSVFAGHKKCEPHIVSAPAAPQPAQQDAKPIYQYQLATGGWIDQTRDSYEYNKANGVKGLRIVYEVAPQQPLTDEKDALLRQALEALEGFANITNDSQGVAGYHLSGDTAEWDEFDEVDAASNTIEAIRAHLGVKP